MRVAPFLFAVVLLACGDDPPKTPGRFGEVTSAVVIVNPVINEGSSTSVESGTARSGIDIVAADLPVVTTDSSGLALIEELPTGKVTLDFDPGTFDLTVVQPKELYDVVLSYRDGVVQPLFPPVRYPIGGEVVVVEPGGRIDEAAASDGAIIMLEEGTYPGGFELRSEGVLVFGAWSPTEGPKSIIDGDVTVLGGSGRMRGVSITGKLTSSANQFSIAFSDLAEASITGNGVSLVRNRFTAGKAVVPSSSAVLVDNTGID